MRRAAPPLILAALLAALAVPASAADPVPTPDCHGVSAVDKAGDSAHYQTGEAGSPSSDLIAGFITYDGKSAKANIQVDNLTAGEMDPPHTAISWEMAFTTADGPRFVRGYQDRTGTIKWTWGEPRAITDDQTAPRAGGTTTGAIFPGKGGIISIDIPLADIGAKPGTQFKAITLQTRQWAGLPSAIPNTGLPLYSYAPPYDDATGKGAVDVKPCAPGDPVPVPGAGGITPPPAGGGDRGPRPASPSKLKVTVKVPRLSAKKLARSKSFVVRLKGTAKNLAAAVRTKMTPDGKVLGTGRLAKLNKKGKLKIRLKRKIKKGSYFLAITGTNADGAPAEGAVRIRVR